MLRLAKRSCRRSFFEKIMEDIFMNQSHKERISINGEQRSSAGQKRGGYRMALLIEGVAKEYSQNKSGKIQALEKVSLKIEEGEFICFLGPSGCGKSTLLNILAGLEKPSAGQVKLDNQPVKGASPERVMVFQEAALFPWLTVLENVEFGLKMLGRKPREHREIAFSYLKMVHLSNFSDSYPHELSGGMKQRVAIARALSMNPKILLMDEPFAALDAQTRSLLHKELQEIWFATKKTIVFVTHNVTEAVCLADRIFLFTARPGRIKKEFRVEIPRLREEGNLQVASLQNQIMELLKEEIEKVAQAESCFTYQVSPEKVLIPAQNWHQV